MQMSPEALILMQTREPTDFAQVATSGKYLTPPHIRYLNQKIMRTIANGGRLLVSLPPRHGKSELVSRFLPAWFLGTYPDKSILWAGYSQTFADKYGRMVRNLIKRNESRLGIKLSRDSASVREFMIAGHDGGMVATGVGGSMTGRGAHLLLVDDPIKNAKDAASEVIRESQWEWWQSTAYTRLEPGSAAIVVQTRWHMDDLTGRIIENDKEGKWEKVVLPAIATENDPIGRKPGEPLWPERFDLATLEEIRRMIGSYYWAALYQQTPIADGETMFDPAWFRYASNLPLHRPATLCRYWDKASTEDDGDWTVGVLMAEVDRQFYVCDVVRAQLSSYRREEMIRQTAEADRKRFGPTVQTITEQEGGSGGKDSADATVRNLAGFIVGSERVTGDKRTRARPYSAQVEGGNVYLLPGDWHRDYLNELRYFPFAKNDDQVDASSGAFNRVSQGVFPGGPLNYAIGGERRTAKIDSVRLDTTNSPRHGVQFKR